jgi:DNA-binding SARP family transcriptional activator
VPELTFSLLGPPRGWRGSTEIRLGSPQQQAVLAALLLRPTDAVSLGDLVDALWGDEPPNTAATTMRTYAWRLRQVLELDHDDPSVLVSLGDGYRIVLPAGALDVQRAEQAAAQAEAAVARGCRQEARDLLGVALQLWRGEPLNTIPGPFAQRHRSRLTELRLSLLEDRLGLDIDLGEGARLIPELTALTADHPFRERPYGLLMLALYRAGRQADALAVFRTARRLLIEDLGVEPGPDLALMHQRILAADPALGASNTAQARPSPRETTAAPAATYTHTPAQLPADLPRFTGRKNELDQLEASIPEADRPATAVTILVVHGMAGLGKTALAVHAAHRVARLFPDGQLYVNLRGFDPAGTALDPADVLAEFLEALGTPAKDVPATLAARSAKYRSILAGRRVLVLLDNARDAQQIRPLFPGTPGCLALVTSRNQLSGLAVSHQARAVALHQFDEREAGELLASALGAHRVETQPDAVDAIIECCGGLPLALAIVAARAVHSPRLSLDAIARQLRSAGGGLDAFTLGTDPAASIRAVFSWSYRALSPHAARLFRLLALHPGPDFTPHAAGALTAQAPHQAGLLLEELADAHLLTEHTEARHTWHDLLRAYATELVHAEDTGEERERALHRLMDCYTHSAHAASRILAPSRRPLPLADVRPGVISEQPADLPQAAAWFTAEYRVILDLLRTAADLRLDDHVIHLAWAPADFLDQHDLWREALTAQRLAFDATLRLDDPETQARAYRALARAEARIGYDDAAREHLEAALRLLGDEGSAETRAGTHRLLSWVLHKQGAYEGALAQARDAVRWSRVSGHRLSLATNLQALGECHAELGHGEEALVACRSALRILEEVGKRASEESVKSTAALTWDTLGFALQQLDRDDEAADAYERALTLYRSADTRHNLAAALERIGEFRLHTGRADAARTAWSEALAVLEHLESPEADRLRIKLAGLKS